MTKVQFKEAFRRGLGSAFIELKTNNLREKFKDIVLWCCLHNTCYDMQCEGDRGIYLYDSIKLFEDKTFFEEAIIKQFMKDKIDTWLFEQLCNVLCRFATDGSLKARDALYRKYNSLFALLSKRRYIRNPICDERDEFEWLCIWLTSLDGFTAFKKIVEHVGEFFIRVKNSNSIFVDYFYSDAKNKFGEKRVRNYLSMKATKSIAAEAFLNETKRFESHVRRPLEPPTLKDLLEACYETKGFRGRGIAIRFAKTASEEQLIQLAQISIEETNPDIKLELLWVFRKRPFPLNENYIFELAESDNESIRDIAFDILHNLVSDKIHDYAANLIKKQKEMANSLSLLCHCYGPEDETLLVDGVKGLTVSYDDGEWHGVFMEVEKLLDKCSFKFNPGLFIYMYQQTLCSSCRSRLLQIMLKRRILTREILEECQYDSYEDTRKFAVKKLKSLYKKM